MSDSIIRSIQSLSFDNEIISTHGSDTVGDIEPPKKVEKVEFKQNSDGTWSKDDQFQNTNIEKDVVLRQNESDKYDSEVENFTEIAKYSDNKLISIASQINQKKQLIIDKIAEAAGAGCSVGFGTSGAPSPAIVNGITLGIGSVIMGDYPYIKKHGGLDDYSGIPFSSDDIIELSADNSGQGYFSGFTENGGSSVGTYYTVYSGNPLVPITTCAACTAAIETLASEIDDLRSQIDNTLIDNTNKVKERKTESEVFLWGYKSRDSKVVGFTSTNNSTIDALKDIN